MTRRLSMAARWLILLGSTGWLFQAGCARIFTREIEVVFATAANPALSGQSILVDVFGAGLLRLLNVV